MNDRAVVFTAEFLSDFREGGAGELPCQKHRDLPGLGDASMAALGFQVRNLHRKVSRDCLLDAVDRNRMLFVIEHLFEDFFRHLDGDAIF